MIFKHFDVVDNIVKKSRRLHFLKNVSGLDTGRLECCFVQRHGEDQSLGCFIFCNSDDIWELRIVQPVGSHSCRGFQLGGKVNLLYCPNACHYNLATMV